MLTIALIAVPFIFAALIFIMGSKTAKMLALTSTLVQLALSIVAAIALQKGNTELLTFDKSWIGPMGIHCAFQIDGINILMALLSGITAPLIVYSTFNKTFKNAHVFYGLMMMMIGAMLGAFLTSDAFIFYIFYEVALIPIYFMILIWGSGDNRAKVTMKFFVYTIFGSLFMLVSLLYVYQHTTPSSFSFVDLYEAGKSLSAVQQGWVFAGIFIAFAVKMPVFPFHTWQPSTYNAAPTAGTMLLAAIMLKMATYGLIRIAVPMVPDGIAEYGTWAITLSIIGVVYASMMAIVQKNFKLLIAYSSIAHVGIISAGILSSNAQGVQGGLYEMLSHGILAVAMFYIYDMLESRFGHANIDQLGGIRAGHGTFAFLFFVLVMGSVALPLTSGFVGEFLLLIGLYQVNGWFLLFGGLTVVFGAVYMLRAFQKIMLGPESSVTNAFSAITKQETIMLSILVVLVVVLGIYSAPLLDLSNNAVESILATIR